MTEPDTTEARAFLEEERAAEGYVMNLERAWAWRPDIARGFIALRKQLSEASGLAPRELAVLVCATASAREDAYCSLAWGARLARLAGADLAAAVLRGEVPEALGPRERALQAWARQVVRAPGSADAAQVALMRAAGLSDKEIVEATIFIGLRLAFSTINGALGAPPDAELVAAAPPVVRAAVSYGRAPENA